MKTPTLIGTLLLMVLVAACSSSPSQQSQFDNCLDEFIVDGRRAFYEGMQVFDHAAIAELQAVEISAANQRPLQEFTVNGEPLLYHSEDKTQALIDDRYFTDLVRVEAIGLDSRVRIGTAKPALFEHWDYAQATRFLLESEIIETYLHLQADFCLNDVTDNAQTYQEHFAARHSFCTNECQEEDYQFGIQVDKATGLITLLPQ